MKEIRQLSDISDQYHSYIIDLWGVMHDGVRLNEGAYQAVLKLKADHKKICFLSNAPETATMLREKLRALGICDEAYDGLITSGEVAKNILKSQNNIIKSAYFVGIEDQKSILKEAGITQVAVAEDADILLCAGIYNDMLSLDEYREELELCLAHNLPMYCVNPDRIVYSGHYQKLVICAGEMAHYYAAQGGEVVYIGKPHRNVYDACKESFQINDFKGVLAIGDAFETDVAGAANLNMDVLFVASGIHARELELQGKERNLTIRSEKLRNKFNNTPQYITWCLI